MKSLTGQVDSQQVKKAGVYIEEAQLADSILYLYWKQRMAKQYYVFCKNDMIEKLDLHIDEDKLEDQLQDLKIDLRFNFKEDQESDKKDMDNSMNDILTQIDIPFIIQGKEEVLLDLQHISDCFKDTVMIAYKSSSQDSMIIEYPFIKIQCSKVIISIANNDYFTHRYQQTVDYFGLNNKFEQTEAQYLKEKKAARLCGNHKQHNWEFYCNIRDYIFAKPRIASSDIIKILFQSGLNNIFFLLFDQDDDYELQLTIDTIVYLTNYLKDNPMRSKLLRMKSPQLKPMLTVQKTQKESLQTSAIRRSNHSSSFHDDFFLGNDSQQLTMLQEHDFLPVVRKDAIRKNFQVRKIARREGFNGKKQESFILQFRRERTQQDSILVQPKIPESSFQKKDLKAMMQYEYSVSDISQDRSQQDIESSSVLSAKENINSKSKSQNRNLLFNILAQNFTQKAEQVVESVKKKSSLKPRKSKIVQENQLISQFYRECVMKVDEKKQFMFEMFVPVEKKSKINARHLDQQDNSQSSEDGLQTDESMRDQEYDKFADYDLDIQRQQFKKFLQEQKVKQQKSLTANQEPKMLNLGSNLQANALQIKINKQNVSQLQYFKTLSMKSKKEGDQENKQIAEVISGEELEEDDQDNFYLQMLNNLQMIEMLKEVGVEKPKQIKISRESRLMRMFSKKKSFWQQNPLLDQSANDKQSLFNDSRLNFQDSEVNVESINNSLIVSERRNSDNQTSQSKSNIQSRTTPGGQGDFHFQKSLKKPKQSSFRISKKHPKVKPQMFQSSDFLRRNLYMKDQNKIQQMIINAVEINDIEELNQLLPKFDLSIDNYVDLKGNRLLSLATQLGLAEVVKLLLHYGSDTNIKNNEGNTPLHYSINYKFNKITDMLLQYGADETVQNNVGKNPWEGFE